MFFSFHSPVVVFLPLFAILPGREGEGERERTSERETQDARHFIEYMFISRGIFDYTKLNNVY